MLAAIYARYSSENQRPESIEDQVAACRRLAGQREFTIAPLASNPYLRAASRSEATTLPLASNSTTSGTATNSGASNTTARWPICWPYKTTSPGRFPSGCARNFPQRSSKI